MTTAPSPRQRLDGRILPDIWRAVDAVRRDLPVTIRQARSEAPARQPEVPDGPL